MSPIIEEILHFESARQAQQLFNNDPRNLRAVEQALDVKATSREGWIKLEGSSAALEQAKDLFQLLEASLKAGSPVRTRDFLYALNVVAWAVGRRNQEAIPIRWSNPKPSSRAVSRSSNRRSKRVWNLGGLQPGIGW